MLAETRPIAVRPLEQSDLTALYHVYRAVTASFAHSRCPDAASFFASLTARPPHLRSEIVLVATDGPYPVGFARAGVSSDLSTRWTVASKGAGMLFGPFAANPDGSAAAALIAAGLSYLRERRDAPVFAFDPSEGAGFPFYNAGWGGLSETAASILKELTSAGFRIRHREMHLSLSPLEAASAAFPGRGEFQLERRADNRHTLRLLDGGLVLGACHFSRLYPRRCTDPEGVRVGYIDGLSVMDRYQGRGLGRALMQESLARLAELGCDTVWLTTHADNLRAQNLYYSLGFRLVDSSVTLARK